MQFVGKEYVLRCMFVCVMPFLTCGSQAQEILRVGIIGLDTSHAPAFTKMLNVTDDPQWLAADLQSHTLGSHDALVRAEYNLRWHVLLQSHFGNIAAAGWSKERIIRGSGDSW